MEGEGPTLIFISTQLSKMHGTIRIKIRIEQNPDCPNKEYNVIFKHFHQNIRAYPRSKKKCVDQWRKYYMILLYKLIGKYFTLARIRAKRCHRKEVWFVPNTVGGFGGSRDPKKILIFFSLI